MKIVDLKAFLSMPEGTIASKYEPCIFGNLFMKGENVGKRDFTLCYLTNEIDSISIDDHLDKLNAATGESVDMSFNKWMRDGCFEDGQKFAVWEEKDIGGLVTVLMNVPRKLVVDSRDYLGDLDLTRK